MNSEPSEGEANREFKNSRAGDLRAGPELPCGTGSCNMLKNQAEAEQLLATTND